MSLEKGLNVTLKVCTQVALAFWRLGISVCLSVYVSLCLRVCARARDERTGGGKKKAEQRRTEQSLKVALI